MQDAARLPSVHAVIGALGHGILHRSPSSDHEARLFVAFVGERGEVTQGQLCDKTRFAS